MLRGHVPARPATAFHLSRLSLGVLARYSSLPRIYGFILMNKTRFVKRFILIQSMETRAEIYVSFFAFLGRGSGGNRSSPSPRRGRWREAPDEVIQRAVPPSNALFHSVFRIKRSWSFPGLYTAAGPGYRRRSLRPRRRSASDTRRNRARRRPFAARWAR